MLCDTYAGKVRADLFADDAVEPAGVDGVVLELGRLQQLDQVLHGGADVSAHVDLLQSQHQRLARVLAGGARGEQVAELRVGELVDAAVGAHREVAPHLRPDHTIPYQ